jgi:hypothetical protein
MPSPVSGASFSINGTAIADMASATATITRQQIDVTSLGDTYRTYHQGMLEGGTILTNARVTWASGASIGGNAFVQDFTVTVAPGTQIAQGSATLIFSSAAIT